MDLTSGRSQQKYRTRRALLAAARTLASGKQTITVQAVADAAGISRATAYRYFESSEYLMREALLDGEWSSPEQVIGETTDVRERVRRVQRYLYEFTRKNEMAHRLFLAKALESWVEQGGQTKVQLRGARRIPMFKLALEPLRGTIPAETIDRLVIRLAAAAGIETFVALKDVCGLNDEEAIRISEANADAILKSELASVT
jgi:AcrR family transcriptional regulator